VSVTVGTSPPYQVVDVYLRFDGWWCWWCAGLGGPDATETADCICCRGEGEHEGVLPPRCAPAAALTGLDRKWWGIE
jgi:hypothetical protein